jgi:hypothetical protein
MYNSSVDWVVKSIQKTPVVNLNGLLYQEYQDFFDEIWTTKIEKECKLFNFDKLEKQEKSLRKKLSYQSKLSKELNIFFSNIKITKSFEDLYCMALSFNSCDLWQDGVGYFLPPHIDDDRIQLAVQIYLNESRSSGTKFFSSTVNDALDPRKWQDEYLQHEVKEVYYKKNSGYSLLNNLHSLHGVMPNETENRLSIYVRYSDK